MSAPRGLDRRGAPRSGGALWVDHGADPRSDDEASRRYGADWWSEGDRLGTPEGSEALPTWRPSVLARMADGPGA